MQARSDLLSCSLPEDPVIGQYMAVYLSAELEKGPERFQT